VSHDRHFEYAGVDALTDPVILPLQWMKLDSGNLKNFMIVFRGMSHRLSSTTDPR
jgi:hypothetical protein